MNPIAIRKEGQAEDPPFPHDRDGEIGRVAEADGDATVYSIFVASRITSAWVFFTLSPGAMRTAVKCLFNEAKKRKDITENPFSDIEKFCEDKVFADPFSIQEMLYRHYGKYIRNRMRKDGGRFLQGLREVGWETELPAIPVECFTAELRQSKEKGLRELPVTL